MLNEKISSDWARYSFATNALRQGGSIEFVGEALSHSSPNTTKNYMAGFEEEKKREMANKLMKF